MSSNKVNQENHGKSARRDANAARWL